MKKIGLIAAIRQEIQPLLRQFPFAVRSRMGDFHAWNFPVRISPLATEYHPGQAGSGIFTSSSGEGETHCCIVESGIGMANATNAAVAMIEAFKPDLLLNIGFCGALTQGIYTGDLVLAEQLFLRKDGRLLPQTGPLFPLESLLRHHDSGQTLYRGTFVTTETVVSKESIRPLLGKESKNPVLEMESSAVFLACSRTGTPFGAIRSVSDGAIEDPFMLVTDIVGPDFSISRKRAVVALIKNPGYLPQMLRLARNSKLAGNSLSAAVTCLLERLA